MHPFIGSQKILLQKKEVDLTNSKSLLLDCYYSTDIFFIRWVAFEVQMNKSLTL